MEYLCTLLQPRGLWASVGAALQPVATSRNLLLKLQLPTACCCWLPWGWSLLKKCRESRNWEYSQAHLLMKAYGIQDIVIHVVIGSGLHIFMVALIMLGKLWNCSIFMGHKSKVKVYSEYKGAWISPYNYTLIFMYAHTAIRQGDVFFVAITELKSKLHLRCAKSKLVIVIFNCQGKNHMYGPETFPGYSWLYVNWKEIWGTRVFPISC